MVRDQIRETFTERVKAIDPIFKRGDLAAFWPALRDLVAMAPDRVDLSRKKSHYLASLAIRSLQRGDPHAALAFLDFADRVLESSHMIPFLLQERANYRRQAGALVSSTQS